MNNTSSICGNDEIQLSYRISQVLVSTISVLLIKSLFLLPVKTIRRIIHLAVDFGSKRLTGVVFPDFRSIHSMIVSGNNDSESEALFSVNNEAIYSGRIIHVKEFLTLDTKEGCLKSDAGDRISIENSSGANLLNWETRLQIEEKFSLVLESEIMPSVKNIIETGKSGSKDTTNLMKALAHEQTHWLLLRGTSISNTIEAISWRKRIDIMLLTERIHQKCGIKRKFDLNDLETNQKESFRKIDDFSSDAYNCSLLSDILAHQYFLNYFFPLILKVIIEPVTWALIEESVEPSWEYSIKDTYFDLYFDKEYRDIALQIYSNTLSYLDSKQSSRSLLIDLVNKSLDPPIRELEKTNFDKNKILNLLTNRFIDSLKGKTISLSRFEEKRFGNAIAYAAVHSEIDASTKETVQKLDLNIVDMFMGIIEREKIVLNNIKTISSLVTDLGIRKSNDRPTIFINWDVPNEPFFLRYDCITQLTPDKFSKSLIGHMNLITTERPLNRLDDFISDFPTTLDTALWLLVLLGDDDNKDRLKDFFDENLRKSDESFFNAKFAEKLVNLRDEVDITYSELMEHPGDCGSLNKFLKFWYSYLLLAGEHSLDLKLQHGMWA